MDTSRYQQTAVVGSCTSRHEAELQRHVLEEVGIQTSIASDDAGGLHPELAFTRCATYRLLVPADEVDHAREVLADFEPDPPMADIATVGVGAAGPDDADQARVGLGRRVSFWVALLVAAVLIGAAVSNLLNVFTAT